MRYMYNPHAFKSYSSMPHGLKSKSHSISSPLKQINLNSESCLQIQTLWMYMCIYIYMYIQNVNTISGLSLKRIEHWYIGQH